MAKYHRRLPTSDLTRSFQRALHSPMPISRTRDWVHTTVTSARSLRVWDDSFSTPDLEPFGVAPQPPWASRHYRVVLPPHNPKQAHPSILKQEAYARISRLRSASSRLYYTDGSAESDGKAGAAFVTTGVTVSHRLPDQSSAFQAELVAILYALQHASTSPVANVHVLSDSISALQAISSLRKTDNITLLSSIQDHLVILHRLNSTVTLHWVPGHVGVKGNEDADKAARAGCALPAPTVHVPRSLHSIKVAVHKATTAATASLLVLAVEDGSQAAAWYSIATATNRLLPNTIPPAVSRDIHRLRLGFPCIAQVLGENPEPCRHCLMEPPTPLIHYCLECPAMSSLARHTANGHDALAAARVIGNTPLETLARSVYLYRPPR